MVMPCSRSARRPSVSSARFTYSSPRARLTRSTASYWSSKICFESYNRRPMSVLLPSSTDPAVAKRRSSVIGSLRSSLRCAARSSEVALALAVLHGGLGELVVGARGTPLGDPAGGHLGDDLLDGGGGRLDRPGARCVADRAVAHGCLVDLV